MTGTPEAPSLGDQEPVFVDITDDVDRLLAKPQVRELLAQGLVFLHLSGVVPFREPFFPVVDQQ